VALFQEKWSTSAAPFRMKGATFPICTTVIIHLLEIAASRRLICSLIPQVLGNLC